MDMQLSLFLAQVIGVFLMLVSASMIVRKRNINLLFEAYEKATAVYVTGILETMLGVIMVLNHNIWTKDFRVVITLIGWMLLLRGVGRTFFPTETTKTLAKFRRMESYFVPLLIGIFILGAYLAYKGFGY